MANSKWQMANSKWQIANGKWQMANGKWQMANGKWQMANGKWQMANGKWQIANSKWQMANSKWQIVVEDGGAMDGVGKETQKQTSISASFATFEEWMATVPEDIRADPLWSFDAYRKALFLYDLVWADCEQLMHDPRGRALIGQVVDSTGSISANIEEGYGRGFGKDRDHFLRFSIGSARETRGWYFRSRHLLRPEVVKHRISLTSEIIALLVNEHARHRHT
jgi:four helix bundle protein